MHRTYFCAGFALLLGSVSSSAVAQLSAAPGTLAPASNEGGLEEIVVTAQRRAERLQDVPIAVSALSGAQLTSKGVAALDSLVTAVPSLQVTALGFGFTPFLRGVGSTASTPNAEASVATYVDGVYQASIIGNVFGYNNAQRIEVLKGPQGTLFGRNSTGGVIQVITRDPVHDPLLEAQLGYGNYQTLTASAYMSAGLSDAIAADLAVQYADQDKGWGQNTVTGRPIYRSDEWSVRSKILFTPTDRTEVTIAGDYAKRNSDQISFQIEAPNVGLDGVSHRPGRFDADFNSPTVQRSRSWGGSLRVEQDLGFAQFVSITSRRLAKMLYEQDVDATPLNLLNVSAYGRTRQWTQELQLISQADSRLQWTVGGFYYGGVATYSPIFVDGDLLGGSLTTFGTQRTRSFAGYGQATYNITDTTRLTGGLRFTDERQTLRGWIVDLTPVISASQKFDRLTWRISLDQKLSDDVLAYVSFNRGLKTGGYGLGAPTAPGFAPEILDAYEVGLKSEFLNRRARFNAAAFYYDYKDLQVEVFPPASSGSPVAFVENAAKARIKGFDADLQIVPVDGLTLSAGVGYLDGEYRDYPGPAVYSPNPFVPVVLPNASGKRTVRSPKFTGNAGITYDWETGAGSFSAAANISYSGRYYFDAANLFAQDDYAVAGASLTWWSPGDRFGVSIWGRNLNDADYIAGAAGTPYGLLQSPAAPRTYGFTLMTKL